jgi:hypothetical protein
MPSWRGAQLKKDGQHCTFTVCPLFRVEGYFKLFNMIEISVTVKQIRFEIQLLSTSIFKPLGISKFLKPSVRFVVFTAMKIKSRGLLDCDACSDAKGYQRSSG